MQRNFYLTWLLATLLITSCTNEASVDNSTPESIVIPTNGSESTGKTNTPLEVTAQTPDEKTILADIYKKPIQAGTDNQLSDGRYVSYWSGSQFTLDGKKYFVAFSDATPESEIEYPAPEDMVTISQATYELVGSEWKLKAIQHDVGNFGSNNKAPMVNSDQKTVASKVGEKNLMLATPSLMLAMSGMQLYFYELFSFSTRDYQWKYLGSVEAGYDNSAGCDHEDDSVIEDKCVRNTGTPLFSATENVNWPELKVAFQGTDLDKDGNVMTLTNKKTVTYIFDEKSFSYQPAH